MEHSRAAVFALQQAHGDHIESLYRGLQAIPGNPRGSELRRFGATRVFCADENRMENRALFTGNETDDELAQVADYFQQRRRTCFVELNPANFYRTEPFSWRADLMPRLLKLGFVCDAHRCVWACGGPPAGGRPPPAIAIERFAADALDRFSAGRDLVVGGDETARRHAWDDLRFGQSGEGWSHYLGLEGSVPVSTSSLFVKGEFGYLKWGFTRPEFQRRGHQAAHIHRRVHDAFAAGCRRVFAVTDFETTSGRNLQRCGLKLAYNYLLMVRPA